MSLDAYLKSLMTRVHWSIFCLATEVHNYKQHALTCQRGKREGCCSWSNCLTTFWFSVSYLRASMHLPSGHIDAVNEAWTIAYRCKQSCSEWAGIFLEWDLSGLEKFLSYLYGLYPFIASKYPVFYIFQILHNVGSLVNSFQACHSGSICKHV